MKKIAKGSITNPERNARRVLRLTVETVRLLRPEALAEAMSGCDTTSYATQIPQATKGC
jgi:uncharacterized protein with ACT and thioredoxin-like domain